MRFYFLSVFILIWCISGLLKSVGENTISPNQIIRVNETITSTAENFALGFFRPGNSTSLYVGVWYNKVPQRTVIWVANREKPITDSSAVLSVTSHGDLVILVNNSTLLWSSNSSNATATAFQAGISAVLLDNGNVVLMHGNGTPTWQSFDYPTDTFLPGMRITLDLKTRKTTLLTSWKDDNNPAAGEFSLGIDPNWPASQLLIWRNSTPFWRSAIWSGIKFEATDLSNYLSYLTIGLNEEEVYITVTNSDTTNIVSRFRVDQLGRILLLSWNSISRQWDQLIVVPLSACDSYGRCGPSGSCYDDGLKSVCRCLEGYEPRIEKQGCQRQNSFECKKSEKFQMIERMKLPNFPVVLLEKPSRADCEAHCLNNCSCTAYSFLNVTLTRCFIWTGDLIDLREGVGYSQDLYVRVSSSKFGTGGSSKKKYLIPVILSAVLASFLCLGTLAYVLWRKRLKIKAPSSWFNLGTKEAPNLKGFNTTDRGDNIAELPIFPFDTIIAATKNFSSANKLGEGGFGPVYKGTLAESQEIAVKRLSRSSGQGLEELKNEIELIAKLQHTNLVRLLGWCIHGEEKILIYEYMSNTSLDKILFDASRKAVLDWRKRFCVIEGIAQGLLYLHRYSRLRIIHRDLKPSNILLDGAMNPKISDFGLARIFGGNQTEATTNRVVGTYGYMSPEYALDGLFSEKSDVFSFGVILIEMVSGKRSTGFYPSINSINLIGYVWQLWSEGRDIELMDPSLCDSFVAEEVIKCIRVGLLCVQENAKDRPKMSTVVAMLGSESTSLPSPTRPAFYLGPSTPTMGSSNIGSQYCSNEATMSQVEP